MLDASIGEEQNIFFESVFVLSEVGNVVVSRLRDGEQHSSLYSYVGVCVLHTYLILSKCGVSRRLFQSRSYHNLLLDRRKLAPHFLCIYTNPTARGVATVIAY